MQQAFDFAAGDLAFIRHSLSRTFAAPEFERRQPVWQLTRSLIGTQTYDVIAEPAFRRLIARWPSPASLAAASAAEIEKVMADVNHAERKAAQLVASLRWIGRERPDFDLSFLAGWPVHRALAWLERLPGVGAKVAAATLNASTLARPVFIVDSHVHRILLRFGFIGPQASAREGRDAVTAHALDAEALLALFVLMKRLGQTLCRPFAPRCGACPLALRCRKQVALGLPPPSPRRPQAARSSSRHAPRIASRASGA